MYPIVDGFWGDPSILSAYVTAQSPTVKYIRYYPYIPLALLKNKPDGYIPLQIANNDMSSNASYQMLFWLNSN